MAVSRGEILRRGLRNACPNCGRKTLFRAGRWFEPNRVCPHCGMEFERGDGFFLGAMTLNYGLAVFGAVAPLLLLGTVGVVSFGVALTLAVLCGLTLPIALYRPTRSWWLMCYFFILPQQLPVNQTAPDPDDDDNL